MIIVSTMNITEIYIYILFFFFAEKPNRNKEKSKRDGEREKRLISGESTERGSRDPCIDVHGVKKNATTLNVRSDLLESYSSPFIFR